MIEYKGKLAIIGASYLQLPLVKRAQELGLYTICFAWPNGAVCREVANEFYPISVVEKERILDICREKGIDGICSIASDVSAPTVAYVAERLGLVGNSFESAVRANDKKQMRDAFVVGGIPCPRYQQIDCLEELDLTKISFPAIVKPVDRSGSLGVSKVDSVDELMLSASSALDLSLKHQAIVEDYIEGREISVEFISFKGKHYPLQITDKVTTGAPHFVELEHHQPAILSNNQRKRIFELTQKALCALGITNGASHSEFKISADGLIKVVEIGARMGGDFIGSDLVFLSTGYDFLKGVIDISLDRFEEPVLTEKGFSGIYFLCRETTRLLPYMNNGKSCGIIRSEITDIELHEVLSSSDRSGYLIYSGDKRLVI